MKLSQQKNNKKIVWFSVILVLLVVIVLSVALYVSLIKTKKEPLDLEVKSGVTLVGTIKRIDKQWCFISDRPLNIKYTYYAEQPQQFNGIKKIKIAVVDEYNIDYTKYENKYLAVTGELTLPRGSDELYFLTYKFQDGNLVGTPRAEKKVTPPNVTEPVYDEKTIPDKVKPKTENGHYVYNPYILSKEAQQKFGNDFVEFYIKFVDAYLNYETSIECTNKDFGLDIWSVVFNEFLLFNSDAVLNNSGIVDTNTNRISWTYSSKSREEHEKKIREFETKVNEFLKEVNTNQSDLEKSQRLYHKFCPLMTYDYSELETREHINGYYAFTKNSGICITFSSAYAYLLTSVGVENTTVGGETATIPHAWNVITINGKNYFADPTFELSYNNGMDFVYFGISMETRLNSNQGFDKSKMHIGRYESVSPDEYKISDTNLQIMSLD